MFTVGALCVHSRRSAVLWRLPEAVRCKRKQRDDWLFSEQKGGVSAGPPQHLLCCTEIQPSHLLATHTWDPGSKNTGKLGVRSTSDLSVPA